MRKILFGKLLFVGMFVLLFNQSCTDLEEEVFSNITASSFFETEEEIVAAFAAAYTQLYQYTNEALILGEVASDELVVPTRGNDWGDGGNWVRMHLHESGPNDDRVRFAWTTMYSGVSSCNNLIAQFEELSAQGTTSVDPFINELKVLRAYFYWVLMDLYGNVPLSTMVGESNIPNEPSADMYSWIVNEVTSALPTLSEETGAATYARFNKWAAHALLAKLYLNAEKYTGPNAAKLDGTAAWSDVVTHCDAIINSGNYSLESDFFANFNITNENSGENILVIPYDQVFAGGFNLVQRTLHYGSQQTYNLQEQPWNGFCTLEEFYDSFDDADVRKGSFLAGPQLTLSGEPVIDPDADAGDPDGPPLNFTPEINELQPQAYRQAGARIGKWQFEIGGTQNMSNDYALFRYSDVLLMKAEALWRMNNSSADALALVNQVRQRAGVPDFTTLTEDDLLAERGREFFYEGFRRQDLIRFGKYNDAWWEKPADASDHINIFPIPDEQLQANPALVQNPGY